MGNIIPGMLNNTKPTDETKQDILQTASKVLYGINMPKIRPTLSVPRNTSTAAGVTVEIKKGSSETTNQTTSQINTNEDKRVVNAQKDHPAYGFIAKETPAYITITDNESNGKVITLNNILLQTVQYDLKEKQQIMSMLDNTDIVYFFGSSVPVLNVQALCLDSKNQQWLNKFLFWYNNAFKGTSLVLKGLTITLAFDDKTYYGVLLNLSCNKSATNLNVASISFSMVISDRLDEYKEEGFRTSERETIKKLNVPIKDEAEQNIINRVSADLGNDEKQELKNVGNFKLKNNDNTYIEMMKFDNVKKIADETEKTVQGAVEVAEKAIKKVCVAQNYKNTIKDKIDDMNL